MKPLCLDNFTRSFRPSRSETRAPCDELRAGCLRSDGEWSLGRLRELAGLLERWACALPSPGLLNTRPSAVQLAGLLERWACALPREGLLNVRPSAVQTGELPTHGASALCAAGALHARLRPVSRVCSMSRARSTAAGGHQELTEATLAVVDPDDLERCEVLERVVSMD